MDDYSFSFIDDYEEDYNEDNCNLIEEKKRNSVVENNLCLSCEENHEDKVLVVNEEKESSFILQDGKAKNEEKVKQSMGDSFPSIDDCEEECEEDNLILNKKNEEKPSFILQDEKARSEEKKKQILVENNLFLYCNKKIIMNDTMYNKNVNLLKSFIFLKLFDIEYLNFNNYCNMRKGLLIQDIINLQINIPLEYSPPGYQDTEVVDFPVHQAVRTNDWLHIPPVLKTLEILYLPWEQVIWVDDEKLKINLKVNINMNKEKVIFDIDKSYANRQRVIRLDRYEFIKLSGYEFITLISSGKEYSKLKDYDFIT